MRQVITTLVALAAALVPAVAPAQAQGAGIRVVGKTGLEAFGGVFSIAPNADLAMEGPGRDVGRDTAAYWVTYRWANAGRSAAACEVNLSRFDFLGFNAVMPDQVVEDEKEAAHLKALVDGPPKEPWIRSEMARRPWGNLSLLELASVRNDGQEVLNVSSRYIQGPYTYTIEYFCTKASLADMRAMVAAIAARNITQR